tara:strand:+ start:275 stop:946 length:672 start_codon:yes stop_codon:yes gene_type:complete
MTSNINYDKKVVTQVTKHSDLMDSKKKVNDGLVESAKEIVGKNPDIAELTWTDCKKKFPTFANSLMISEYMKDDKLMAYCNGMGLLDGKGKNPVLDGISLLLMKKPELTQKLNVDIATDLKGSNVNGDKVHGLCHNKESNMKKVFDSILRNAKGKQDTVKQHFMIYADRNLTKMISPLNTILKGGDKVTQGDKVIASNLKQDLDKIHAEVQAIIQREKIEVIS